MPGRVATERVQHLDSLADDPEAARRRAEESIPLRRYGRPEEFGELACEIVSNTMLNGMAIRLDGALRMPPR